MLLKTQHYPIYYGQPILEYLPNLVQGKECVLISDDQIPESIITPIAQAIACPVLRFPAGEKHKTLDTYQSLMEQCTHLALSRQVCLIALGGGLTGDMVGFLAATYRRGIDFIQIPTTTLAQIDSSVGGKTGVNVNMAKNMVGAFHHPKAVLIDPSTRKTLSKRQINAGLVEALKMGYILDESLVERFEQAELNLDDIILQAIELKVKVVEQDFRETGLRQCLNFGHTIGHAIEAYSQYAYEHGECVGFGMRYMTRQLARLDQILARLDQPTPPELTSDQLMPFIRQDKKGNQDGVNLVLVDQVGQHQIQFERYEQIKERIDEKYPR